MNKIKGTNFPDSEFLNNLIRHIQEKVNSSQQPLEKLITHCSAAMNWIADYITDENVAWSKKTLPLDALWLTRTNPKWNVIVIDKCERSPQKLRELLNTDSSIVELFSGAVFEDLPILVRYENEKYKVLDGMHRTIAAIRDGRSDIQVFIAKVQGNPKPKCEPHVVYDLLRAYHRKINTDRSGLITALRFLRHSYANVEDLLKNRFSKSWVPDDEIQTIIQESLKD